jgi:hypothetical protein
VRRQKTAFRGADEHAPEFEQTEFLKAFPDADLRIQNRAAIIELDRHGNQNKQRDQKG